MVEKNNVKGNNLRKQKIICSNSHSSIKKATAAQRAERDNIFFSPWSPCLGGKSLHWGFDVRFNPAMSGKTFLKPRDFTRLTPEKEKSCENLVSILWLKSGKRVLPTSCRFNPVSRHPYSVGKTDNGHESRTRCTAPNKSLAKSNKKYATET